MENFITQIKIIAVCEQGVKVKPIKKENQIYGALKQANITIKDK